MFFLFFTHCVYESPISQLTFVIACAPKALMPVYHVSHNRAFVAEKVPQSMKLGEVKSMTRDLVISQGNMFQREFQNPICQA